LSPPLTLSLAPIKPAKPDSPEKVTVKMEREGVRERVSNVQVPIICGSEEKFV